MAKGKTKLHVARDLLNAPDDRVPDEDEKIVRLIGGRGNDIHEVEEVGGEQEKFLVTMPGRFRKLLWVKRGDYLLVKDIAEGGKVKGEITEMLTKKRISWLRKEGHWPRGEETAGDEEKNLGVEEFVNDNRSSIPDVSSSSSSDDEC